MPGSRWLARTVVRAPSRHLLIGAFEFAQDVVAAGNGGVEGFLAGLLAAEDGFEFLVDDVANLGQVAEADTLGIVRRRATGDLLDGDVRTRIFSVVALFRAQFESSIGDRQVAGELVPVGLDFR